jgi:TP901 family phage tail tape measure protein
MADSTTIGKLVIQMLLDSTPFSQGVEQVKSGTNALGSQLKSWADGLNTVVVGAMKAAGLAMAGLAAASTAVGAQFQQKMQYVGVVAGATEEQMKHLTATARELGSTTTYSASQAADAMALLAGSGLDTAATIKAAGDALRLAGVDGASMDVAAAALTATMAQFSLTADESGRIADVFAKATALSQFKVDSLSDAMKYGGTVGAGFGWSLEQTVAALAMFRDAGLDGARAGTALRSSMSQATMVNEKNIETMAKYGLTMEAVNPETNTFAQILEAVGKAGMTTTDAMVVFGVEAGATIKTLAEQAAQGSTKYAEMLNNLENSTGTAEAMYSKMNETVSGSFIMLKSAAEEVLLVLFDTYKGPLAELLGAVMNVVNATGEALGMVAGSITSDMGDALGSVTDFLNTNADFIGESIAGWLKAVADFAGEVKALIPIFQAILPLLDDIALTMGLIWVATKVMAFVKAVSEAQVVVALLKWDVRALAAELTAATGGLYALIAAIGVLVVGMVALITRYNEAERSARALKDAQDALAGSTAAVNQERAAYLESLLSTQREEAKAALVAELAAGDVSRARQTELEILSKLTGATAQQMEAEGKLVLVRGQLRTAASIGTDLNPDDVNAFNSRVKEMESTARASAAELQKLKDSMAGMEETAKISTSGATGDALRKMVTDSKARIAQLEDEVPRQREAISKLSGDLTKAENDVLAGIAKNHDRIRETRGKTATDGAKKEKEYVDRVAEMHRGLLAELAGFSQTDLQRVDVNIAERKAKVEASYADQIKAAGGNTKEVARLQAQLQADLTLLTGIGEQERKKLIIDAAKEAADKRMTEQKRVLGLIAALEVEGLSTSEKLEREKADTLAGIDDSLYVYKTRLSQLYDDKIQAARDEEAAQAASNAEAEISWLSRVTDAWYDVAGAIGSVWSTARGFTDFLSSALEKLTGFAFSLSDALSSISQSLTESVGTVNAAWETVVSAKAPSAQREGEDATQYAARQYVENLVAGAASFSTVLMDAIPVLLQQLVQAIPQVVDVFIATLPSIVTALLAVLPPLMSTLVDAGVKLIDSMLTEIPRFVIGLVQMVPELVRQLLAQIPVIITGLVAGVADIVVAVLQALPEILNAVVKALPDIIIAVIDSVIGAIPQILAALIRAVPRLIAALLRAVPIIIDSVMSQVPFIILTLVGMIPDLIIALAQALPTLIPAIVALIPDIITAIIPQLPTIAVSLLEAIVFGLIAKIPEIAVSIGKAIVQALTGAWKALVDALIGLLKAAWNAVLSAVGLGSEDSGSHYAGINYVPATMRVTVHPGEMVVPASRNPMRAPDRADPALAGSPSGAGGRSSEPVQIGIYSDGRLVETALVNGQNSGRATKLTRMMRSTAKVKAGLDRGKYNGWSK